MSDHPNLSRNQLATLEHIFQHPITHNLEWREVVSLFELLGQVKPEHNGHLKVTIQGETQAFHRPLHKDVADDEQVMDIRHFLEEAGINPQTQTQVQDDKARQVELELDQPFPHLLVVINHHETKIFETDFKESQLEILKPYDPHYYLHHLHHKQGDFQGQYAPEEPAYYEAIVEKLRKAEVIIIFGNATGHSSAEEQLMSYLQQHHLEIARRVIGVEKLDIEALSDNQLLAQAGSYYSRVIEKSA